MTEQKKAERFWKACGWYNDLLPQYQHLSNSRWVDPVTHLIQPLPSTSDLNALINIALPVAVEKFRKTNTTMDKFETLIFIFTQWAIVSDNHLDTSSLYQALYEILEKNDD